jgi:hypothetical protein
VRCPACELALDHVEVAPSFFLDVCRSGCQGIWFDNQELQAIDEADEHPDAPVVQLDASTDGTSRESGHKRPCPRCEGIKMRRFWFSWRQEVEVDQCGQCGGYWLDAGELTRVRGAFGSAEAREAEAERRATELMAGHEAEQEARSAPLRERERRRGRLGRALDALVADVAEWL